ncbi:hypothetical protein KIN20_028040 [Parelaphostrongylus tenuis]|uniref:Uncharacterized protein n=1 Tax=Parelaphostrongylus tenuis TaxID=148309 RepID=A0AAD5R0G5_PARTN|nr:hypothetical protein KIN20_028040 [Parelaphostrongylus tenuis]
MKSSKEAVQAFVLRFVMQTVFDVLDRQGRSALLPDAVISEILSQLSVNVTYAPLQCQKVALDPANDMRECSLTMHLECFEINKERNKNRTVLTSIQETSTS